MRHRFNSAPFVRFLEKVTGIDNMIADLFMRGRAVCIRRRAAACCGCTPTSTDTTPMFWTGYSASSSA